VLLISVGVVLVREVADKIVLIGVEVATNSEVEDTTSLANIKEMLGSSVGAAASSLTSAAVLSARAIPMVAFSIGAVALWLAIEGGITMRRTITKGRLP
jgi:CHASE2 domain-containing sensor protein